MFQKQLKVAGLSTAGATFARFFFAAPFVIAIAISYGVTTGQGLPELPPVFWAYVVVGGTSQILATMCVVALFSLRHFAVGITFKKTEVLLSVLIGFVILGDAITLPALIAVMLGLGGVLLLADPPDASGAWHQRIMNKAVLLGLTSGLFFGLSGVSYRGASLSIGQGDTFYRAIVAMAFVVVFQFVTMLVWLKWREAGQIWAVIRAWRIVSMVGLTSMIGTMCWFTAFTLQSAGYVNAVGQIELLFSIAIGALVFGERISTREWQGLILLTGSIVMLVLVA
jgi:drug/metabolite transporter (DMT)-like permease